VRNAIPEDERVSAFRNFLIRASAESFPLFVFDTVQSKGTNKLKIAHIGAVRCEKDTKIPGNARENRGLR
jgi:hypothetical protein